MPFLSVGDDQLYYHHIAGEKEKAVLLLHSLGTNHQLYHYQYQPLAEAGYTVVAPDARGHGQSSCKAGVSVDLWVSDLLHLLNHLELEKVVLCGVSMGGVEAMAFAVKHPERVQALILADTFAKIEPSEIPVKISATAGMAEQQGMETYADSYLDSTLSDSPAALQLREKLRQAIAGMSVEAYKASAEACFGADLEQQLAALEMPALILIGEEDFKTPLAMSQQINAQLPQAKLEVIPKGRHLSNVDQPEAFNQLLTQFLQQVYS